MGGYRIATFVAFFVLTFSAHAKDTNRCDEFLLARYGVDLSKVETTPNAHIPVIFRGDDSSTLTPQAPAGVAPVRELKKYDVVIPGGGASAMTAALYLARRGKSVLLLERNEQLGGVAIGNELNGIGAGGGAAYSVGPETEREREIFKLIGLENYETSMAIAEPIDSYLWNGKLYKGIWEDHTLAELPAAFELFKYAMKKLEKDGVTGAEALGRWADAQTMDQLVRKMPELVKQWIEPEGRKILARFHADKNLPPADPMRNVIDLLDLYGRSALGGPASQVNARTFITFYLPEMGLRYTGTLGTGTISQALSKKLKEYSHLVEIRTSTPVVNVESVANGAVTTFLENGVLKEVHSRDAILSTPITLAPKLVKNLAALDPEKAKAISQIEMTDYVVHVVRVKGHPFRATYDTWVYNNGDLTKATDYILGRWQDPKIKAYEGMRDFEKDPADDYGVITIYEWLGKTNPANFEHYKELVRVENSVREMIRKLEPLVAEHGRKFEVELVESYRHPASMHVVAPGALDRFPILERSAGHIHFANNSVGAPELEPAMAHAAEVAEAIADEQEREGTVSRPQSPVPRPLFQH